jgi:oxaloacetate decarboxylase gamma subunit
MDMNLVAEGLKFMVLGMTTVFLFLILMVIVLNFQAKMIAKYFPAKPPAPPPSRAGNMTAADDTEVVAAIIAAIRKYREK